MFAPHNVGARSYLGDMMYIGDDSWGAETRSSRRSEFVFVDESAKSVVAVHSKRLLRERCFGR
jgi:hypothetical protein